MLIVIKENKHLCHQLFPFAVLASRENMLLLCDTVELVRHQNRAVIFEGRDLQSCAQNAPAVNLPQHPTFDPGAATLIAALLTVTQGNTFSGLSL